MMMKKRNLTICILLGVFSLILFSCAILINSNLVYVQASAENSELITNRNDFKNAVINANDGDTLLVGDIDFNLQATGDVNEGERITIDKSITLNRTVHDSVVGYRNGVLVKTYCFIGDIRDSRRAVKQAIFCMKM